MKNLRTLFVIAAIASFLGVKAESTVYIFLRKLPNTVVNVKINGKKAFDMQGKYLKEQNVAGFKVPLTHRSACMKECVVKKDQKLIMGVELEYVIPTSGEVTHYLSEMQLNLLDGDTYFIDIAPKGMTDFQLKMLDEKKGLKLLNSSKYEKLPVYNDTK